MVYPSEGIITADYPILLLNDAKREDFTRLVSFLSINQFLRFYDSLPLETQQIIRMATNQTKAGVRIEAYEAFGGVRHLWRMAHELQTISTRRSLEIE